MKIYKLFSDGPGSVFGKYRTHPRPWIIKVRARSIRQAYWLVAHQQVSIDGGVGITWMDHSHGPEMLDHWPFRFDISEVGNNWGK